LTAKLCAAALSLLGFSTSMFIGLWVDNSFVTVVMRSLGVMILFYFMGLILAGIGQKVVEESFNNEIESLKTGGPELANSDEEMELETPGEQMILDDSPVPVAHG